MMSQIRLRQSQVGERLGRADGRYVVEGVMQEQLKHVRNVYILILSASIKVDHLSQRRLDFSFI